MGIKRSQNAYNKRGLGEFMAIEPLSGETHFLLSLGTLYPTAIEYRRSGYR